MENRGVPGGGPCLCPVECCTTLTEPLQLTESTHAATERPGALEDEDRQHKATLRYIRDIHPSRRAVRTPHKGGLPGTRSAGSAPRSGGREARGPSQAHVSVEASSHRPHPRAALSRPLTAPRTPPTSGARGRPAPASAGR
jgi:hypothetical protein